MDLNKVMVIGRLTRDPELRSLPSGKSVAVFSVATGRQWTDAQGQKQKQTEFHNCVAWGKMAETASQYLHKASRVYVEGRIQTREWTGADGNKRNRSEIVADNFIMLDSRPPGSPASGGAQNGSVTYEPTAPAIGGSASGGEEEIKVEDIPF